MILTEKTQVKINPKNFKHYKKLHYTPIIGEMLDVFVKDLTKCSSALIKIECDICHCIKIIKYENYYNNIKKYGYYSCNGKCSKNKLKRTCKERYGDEHFFKCNTFLEKKEKTCLTKYGVNNYTKSDIIKKKSKKTKKNKYNDENYNNRERAKKTCIKLYGVDHPSKLSDFGNKVKCILLNKYGIENYNNQAKTIKTSIEKYGVAHSSQYFKVKAKKESTNIKKYGFKSALQNEDVKKKTLKTNIKRYGVNCPMQNPNIFLKQQKSSYVIKIHAETGLYYRGTYEKDFLDMCHIKNIPIQQGKRIKYINNNKHHYYFSDFYLMGHNMIIEIKSSYTFKKMYDLNIIKKDAAIKEGYKFIFIINKDYAGFLDIVKIPSNIN